MTGSNGTGVDLSGPLAGMWRDVYRKAGEAAEARARELLKYHVYVYPHGAGGGGGAGGGWVLLDAVEVTAVGGQLTIRLPQTGSAAQTHGMLVLEARVRSTYTGASREYCTLTLNDEPPVFYASTLTRNDVGTVSGFASNTDTNWDVGSCPKATAPSGTYGLLTVQLPLYARTDHKKHYLAHSVASTDTEDGNAYLLQAGGWVHGAPEALAAIASVRLRCANGNLAQGSYVRLWGVTTDGAGGGGDGADVTITTDASLVATEAPANTFALAARLSPDANNALALRANGLYATDTGGGGGTGNTTMYTQTSAPTGATNSLWFNPSESA